MSQVCPTKSLWPSAGVHSMRAMRSRGKAWTVGDDVSKWAKSTSTCPRTGVPSPTRSPTLVCWTWNDSRGALESATSAGLAAAVMATAVGHENDCTPSETITPVCRVP